MKTTLVKINTEYGITPVMFALNPVVFNSMKRMKKEGLPDVFAAPLPLQPAWKALVY